MKKSLYTGIIAFVVIAIVNIPSFAANPTPVLLVDFGANTPTDSQDSWISANQSDNKNFTKTDATLGVSMYLGVDGGNNFNITTESLFSSSETFANPANTATHGLLAEMKSTLGLASDVPSEVWADGMYNGQASRTMTITISGLPTDSSKCYTLYAVYGATGKAHKTQFNLTGYDTSTTPVLCSVEGDAEKYTKASSLSVTASAAQTILLVRVHNIYPNSEGKIIFTTVNNYPGINCLALAETDYIAPAAVITRELESETETWSTASEWTDEVVPSETSSVELKVTSETGSTLTLDADASVDELTISGDYAVKFDGEESLTASATAVNTDVDVSGITASLGAVTIAEDKTLTIGTNTTVSIANGANLGTIHVTGGTTDAPVILNNGTAADDNIGAITIAADSVLRLYATGGNKVYNVTGAGSTSRVLLTSNQDWGISNNNNSKISNCTLEIPQYVTEETENYNLWITPSKIGEDVALEIGQARTIYFENDNNAGTLNIVSLAGAGNVAANGSHTISINGGNNADYSGIIPGTHNIVKTGEGTQTLSGVNTYSGTTTISEGALKLTGSGALGSGAVTVNESGCLVYNVDVTATPANAFTGAGTITADACTLNLTSADISEYAGTYATANEGKIILPAGAETTENIAAGSSIILKLTAAQMVTGYTATVPDGMTVVFYDNTGNVIEGDTVSGNTFTPARNTWTKVTDDTWETVANWSNNAAPSAEDSVCISITGDTTITLASAVTVANLEVKGSGTLTIAGAKLTVSNLMIANTSVTAGADLLGFANLLIGDEMSVSVENASELTVNSINGGTFIKSGQGNLHMSTTDAAFITLKDTILNVQAGALIMRNSINLENATLNFTDGTYWKAHGWPSIRDTIVVNTAGDLTFGAADGTTPSLGNGRNGKVIKKGAGTFTFSTRDMTNAIAFQIDEGAVGILEGGTLSGVISGEGKLINKSTNRTLILSNANNSYTGGTEIENGAILRVNGLAFLGPSGDVNIAEGATLDIYTTENTQDHGNDWNRLKGNGTVAYNSSGSYWRTFPTIAKSFPTTLTVENNLATGLILPEYAQAYKIGSLQGTGAFRVDFGGNDSNPRSLEIIQSKNTTFSGGMIANNSPGRLSSFYLSGAEGAENKTLTYSGTTTVAKPMTVNASGVLNLTGSWTGAMTVAGTIGGTGTIGGALTLNAGAIVDATAGALTVGGALTLPTDGTVTVNLPEKPEVGMALLKYVTTTELNTDVSIKKLEVGKYTLVEETADGVTTVKLGPKTGFMIIVR